MIILCISVPCRRPRVSQKESASSSWETMLEAKIWVLGTLFFFFNYYYF